MVATVAVRNVAPSRASMAPSINGGYSTGKSRYGVRRCTAMAWKRATSPVRTLRRPLVASWLRAIGTDATRAAMSSTARMSMAREVPARRPSAILMGARRNIGVRPARRPRGGEGTLRSGGMIAHGPAWNTAPQIDSGADNPAVGDQAVPAGHYRSRQPERGSILGRGGINMLRLQAPLPDRYTRATADDLDGWLAAAKSQLGSRLLVLGHHYQRPEVIRWADERGDSFKLAQFAAANEQATDIIFCGVHFMAESADILTGDHQRVILPDLNAGCSMADMADLDQVLECWDEIAAVTDVERIMPITYMNSSADLKAFVGEHGGAVCTSSNARIVLEWAFQQADKVLFFPDQHLGRNTGYEMGYDDSHMRVWDPRRDLGGLDEPDVKEATFLLWKGHCTVHQRFQPAHVDAFRAEHPTGEVIVHPECCHEVVAMADRVGSTERILA